MVNHLKLTTVFDFVNGLIKESCGIFRTQIYIQIIGLVTPIQDFSDISAGTRLNPQIYTKSGRLLPVQQDVKMGRLNSDHIVKFNPGKILFYFAASS